MFLDTMPANPTLADKFAWHLRFLYNAIGLEWRRRGIGHPLQTAISARLIGLVRRLNLAFAQWRAGTLKALPARRGCEGAPRPDRLPRAEGEKKRRAGAWGALPRGRGWLRRLLPDSAGHMNGFIQLLDDAEMQAMIAAAPQVGRILRPFCHFLGLKLPPALVLPRRPRPRKSSARALSEEDEERFRRLTARFPDTPPARAAKRALRRGFAGLPVDVTKLSAVAYGYFVHPPRDGNCPPPEIGYGGRSFPSLPKDYVPQKNWD